jgi:predicted DNA-binding antitoxin AbrB/MazE fold protein
MREQIEVVYENGVLRPLGPLPAEVHEHERYTVTIEGVGGGESWLDAACAAAAARDGDPAASLEDVRRALAKVPGTLAEQVRAEREER